MNDQTENKLLLAARILLMALLLWLISGRAAVGADLSLIAVLFLVRSIMLRGWNWARCTWFKIGLSPWAWILPITDFIRASAITSFRIFPCATIRSPDIAIYSPLYFSRKRG